MYGVYGPMWLISRLAACHRCTRSLEAPRFRPVPLGLGLCLLGALSGAFVVVALGHCLRTTTFWCTVALATVLGTVLRAAAVLRGERWRRGAGQQQEQQPQEQQKRKANRAAAAERFTERRGRPDRQCPQQQQARSRRLDPLPVAEAEATEEQVRLGSAAARQRREWDSAAESGECAAAAAGGSLSAYAAALRAVQDRGLMSYQAVAACAHAHVRVGGMQPEQLCPGWRAELDRRFAEQGWRILNAAVRRGSTRLSLTLANLHAYQAAAAAGEARVGAVPARRAAGGGEAAVEEFRPAGGDADAIAEALVVAPEELLEELGVRREDLAPGFSFTVQAVVDDRRRLLARHTWQQDGTWLRELLDASGAAADGGSAATAVAAAGGAGSGAPLAAAAGGGSGTSEGRGRGHDDGLGRGVESQGGDHSQEAGPDRCHSGPGRNGGGSGGPRPGAAPLRWTLRAPYVLLGMPEPRGGADQRGSGGGGGGGGCCLGLQRYEAEVSVAVTWDAQAGGSSDACGGSGACPGDEPASGDPWDGRDVLFRVRQLGWPCKAVEYRVSQELVAAQQHSAEPTRGSDPTTSFESGSSFRYDSASAAYCGQLRTWNLTVWDEPSPVMADLPAVALPPRDPASDGGDSGHSGGAGAVPCLADLSAWRGEELLAARMVLLMPHGLADPGDGRGVSGGDADRRCWALQLQELLHVHTPEVAQHILVDTGLLLSGVLAFDHAAQPAPAPAAEAGPLGAAPAPLAAAPAPPAPAQGGGGAAAANVSYSSARRRCGVGLPGARGLAASRRLVLQLDLGTGLTSLVLRHGHCALAEVLWASLERLGFGAEEVLLHGSVGARGGGDLPLLHAAVASGEPRAAALVLSWYASAGLPEPWLQPIRIAGSPAVLTPLVLASAASPSGALLSYILRNHPQALAAWRVAINGASGRSVAVTAGLWAVVLEADLRSAVVPAAAAVAAVGRRVVPRRLRRWRHALWRAIRVSCSGIGARCAPPGDCSSSEYGDGAGARLERAAASSRLQTTRGSLPPPADRKAPMAAAVAAAVGKGCSTLPPGRAMDLHTFVAQRTRTQMVAFQLAIVLYQFLTQLKALVGSFEASCPAAAAAATAAAAAAACPRGSWAWLRLARATGRCVAGRLWWTGLEAALAAAMASPLGERHHTLCCVAAAAMRCLFQGFEGSLLPPAQMSATGPQMLLAHVLFVLVTAYCYQAPCRLNALLRLAEGFAAARMYVRYGVTSQQCLAVVLAMGMESLGWMFGAALRRRARGALRRRQLQQHPHLQQQQ
ncbi:hypothetical protein PLESTB_000842700 [Pleodorina starrii]|uniref:Uncharacterized protein n=1 Tax=Pleodorina starrii TaxID=330485 RepID=A0A9W6BMH4_9CHLO|nr:hypothetical protein PLESTB_000842700 [Pleodorina starrii]